MVNGIKEFYRLLKAGKYNMQINYFGDFLVLVGMAMLVYEMVHLYEH